MPRHSIKEEDTGLDTFEAPPPAPKEALLALDAMREVRDSRRSLHTELSTVCLAMYNIETDYIPRSLDMIYATRKLVAPPSSAVGGKRQRDGEGGSEDGAGSSLIESPLQLKRDPDTGDVVSIVGSCRGRSSFRNFLRNPFDKNVDLGENVMILTKEEIKKGGGGGTPTSSTPASQSKSGGKAAVANNPPPPVPEGKTVFSSVASMITAEDSRAYRKELLADHRRYLSLSYPPSFGMAERLRLERLKASRHREVVASLGTVHPPTK